MNDNSTRVGGRHNDSPAPEGGGGYLDICRTLHALESRFSKKSGEKIKITLEDLKKIGLTGKWLEIAERVGVDAWLDIWEILDRENINHPSNLRDALRVRVPMYSKLVKYMRNIFIRRMTDAGLDSKEIHRALLKANVEPVSREFIASIQSSIKKSSENEQ